MTEFLFGTDVCSLSAGPRYPPGHPSSAQAESHPSNLFARAFRGAQEAVARRFHFSSFWPLIEFRKNEVDTRMGVISGFVDPIISAALQKKREKKLSPDVEDEDTLLQYLVRQTSGMSPSSEAPRTKLMELQTTSSSRTRRLIS